MKHKIELLFEPADRSVGIMAEGFSGYDDDGSSWCNLIEYAAKFEECKFEWFDNESGKETNPPANHKFIERLVWTFANEYYDYMDEVLNGE